MHIVASFLYIVCVLIAISWGILMRHRAGTAGATEKTYEVHGLLMVVSLVLVPVLSLSPFHLLWMFPVSGLLGLFSMIFPFNLLWPLASFYGSLWYIGLKSRRTDRTADVIMLKDGEWGAIDGEPCRVVDFTPFASVRNGKVVTPSRALPYALVTLECKKTPGAIDGYVTHRVDFVHLWAAFRKRGVSDGEQVWIIWSTQHYKWWVPTFIPLLDFPRMWVMIWPKGALESMFDPDWKPGSTGEAVWNTMGPIVEWKPEVME